nr:enoyl-CoA hydratase/isomerase family protein [Streptomyces sp. SID12488]
MAVPETGIGFFPDAGASYFLPRLPGAIGMYLGLTGHRLDAADALYTGLATHFVPAHDRSLPGLPGGCPCCPGRQGPHPQLATCAARLTDTVGLSMSAGEQGMASHRELVVQEGARDVILRAGPPARSSVACGRGDGLVVTLPTGYGKVNSGGIGSDPYGCLSSAPAPLRRAVADAAAVFLMNR